MTNGTGATEAALNFEGRGSPDRGSGDVEQEQAEAVRVSPNLWIGRVQN